jgi:hypothetical protein
MAEACRGRAPVIAINDAIYQAPFAEIHYTTDKQWWEWADAETQNSQKRVGLERARQILADFTGFRVTIQNSAERCALDPTMKVLRNDTSYDARGRTRDPKDAVERFTGGLCLEPDGIRTGRNSGHMALNIAVHTGAKRVLLLGYDLHGEHWFGKHPKDVGRPLDQWQIHFATLPPILKEIGVEVINVTPGSHLNCFPRGTLEDCL